MTQPLSTNLQDESLSYFNESMEQFVLESVSEVDDEAILARVVGESFFLNKASRNKRFYPDTLWFKVVNNESLKQKLEDRLVYGTIGHNQILDDAAIRDGKVSHIVSKMWITEDGKGMAEFLILNTPAGTVLNTLLRAKSKLYTSTRAKGSFLKKYDNSGNQYVNEDNFSFETIDFVYNPGFLESRPDLVEALQQLDNIERNNSMAQDDKMQEALVSEFKAQRQTIDNLQESLGQKNAQIARLSEEADKAKAESDQLAAYKKLGTIEEITTCMSKLAEYEKDKEPTSEALALAAQFKTLGDFETVKAVVEAANKFTSEVGDFETVTEQLQAFNNLLHTAGTPEKIVEHLTNYLEMVEGAGITSHTEAVALGKLMSEHFTSVEEAATRVEELKKFEEEAGDLESAMNALRMTKNFVSEHSPAQLIADSSELRNFTEEFGELADVRRALHMTNAYMTHMKQQKVAEENAKFAADLGTTVEKVQEWLDRGLSKDDITEMFNEAKTAVKPTKTTVTTVSESKGRVNGGLFLNESAPVEEPTTLQESLKRSRVQQLIN